LIRVPLLFLQIQHGSRNFTQTGFRDIAGRHANIVHGLRRMEFGNILKVFLPKIIIGLYAAARQQHICHAVYERDPVFRLNIAGIIPFLRLPGIVMIQKIAEIVGHIVRNGVYRRRNYGARQSGIILKLPKGVFKALDNAGFVPLFHLPDGNGAGKPACVGVGYVEIMFHPVVPAAFVVKDGNALHAPVHPAPELLIPFFYFQYGGSAGTLRENQDLLVKGQLVIAACRAQKRRPFGRIVCHSVQSVFVNRCDRIVFRRHIVSLPSLFFSLRAPP
jgi:hypothetical protein